jgi:ElaB/YqjD/DUF883 family membrane-anchored ribosome-binding protein
MTGKGAAHMTDYQRHSPGLGHDRVDTRAVDRAMRAGDRTPEQIESDIEATRERMGENIDALGERLSPHHLKEQALEAISDAAHDTAAKVSRKARSAGSRLGHAVREHAVPMGLVGAGMSWLLVKRGDHSGPRDRRRFTNGYPGPKRRVSERSTSGLRGAVDKLGGGVGHVAESVSESVSGAAHSVTDKTGELARQNPLAVAAGAAALGLALGMLRPATRRKDRLMGAARDRLVDTTRKMARTVKKVATERAL